MAYRIKEKFWSLGNSFLITDTDGNPAFYVKGKAFSFGNKLSFQDTQNRELAFISQTLLSLKPRYKIIIDGDEFAEIIKEWSWFNQKFTLDVPGLNDYSIEGAFWSHEYQFTRLGRVVAQVGKQSWGWTDSYGIEIVKDEDVVAILCTCIVIDQILCDQKDLEVY